MENKTRATAPLLQPMNAATLLQALFKCPLGRSEGEAFSPLQTVFEIDRIDPEHVKRYSVLLESKENALPITYYYLIAQRAQLSTMFRKEFPFRIPGMIHVDNDIVEHAPVDARQALRVITTVHIDPPSPTGARYCMLETVAEQRGQRVFTCTSRYLAVRGQRTRIANAPASEEDARPLIGKWELASSAGRQYAAISGDWNPIHLWHWSARLMGFQAPIIHGMHTIGKACAVLETVLGQRIIAISGRFKSPVPLGKEVCLASETETGTFVVSCDGRQAVEGKFKASSL